MNRRTYLVIGASSGIGKQVSEQLLKTGNRVIGTCNKNRTEGSNDKITKVLMDKRAHISC